VKKINIVKQMPEEDTSCEESREERLSLRTFVAWGRGGIEEVDKKFEYHWI